MPNKLSVGHGSDPKWMGGSLGMPEAARLFTLASHEHSAQAVKEVKGLLCRLNDRWMQQARLRSVNLSGMAELFTDSAELDGMICRRRNLNARVRELQDRCDTKGLGDCFHAPAYRRAVIGGVDEFDRDWSAGGPSRGQAGLPHSPQGSPPRRSASHGRPALLSLTSAAAAMWAGA